VASLPGGEMTVNRTGDATAEKIAETNHEKFNELNFLRQK